MKIMYVLVCICACLISFYASAEHRCKIKDGEVVCTGDNESGQCNVPPLKNPRQVVTDDDLTCVLDDEGVLCWGWDKHGREYVPPLRKVLEIFFRWENTLCATDESDMGVIRQACWGEKSTVKILSPNLDKFSNIVEGKYHQCGFYKGSLECWGENDDGQTNVPALNNPRQVAVGGNHTCALDDNGVKCWGYKGTYGQFSNVPPLRKVLEIFAMGNISCAIDESPTGIKRKLCWGNKDSIEILFPSLGQFTSIVEGDNYQCGFYNESLECWGKNDEGQANVPVLDNTRQVAAGGNHTCALGDNGVTCWGDNEYGQNNVPTLENPRQVVVGGNHTCALDDNGVKCWGEEKYGLNSVPPLRKVLEISISEDTLCAIDESLTVIKRKLCWGYMDSIEILFPGLGQFISIVEGDDYQCGFYKGSLECWGANRYNRLNVPTLKSPRQIAVAKSHACALDDDGVKCWGYYSSSTNVPPLKNPQQLIVGDWYSCALDDDEVKCWGTHADLLGFNNSYSAFLVLGVEDDLYKISRDDNAGITDLSRIFPMFLAYVFKNELRFFYSFDKLFGEKLFKIFGLHSKYSKLFTLFHSELKKEMRLIDTEEKYRFLWNKDIYLPYGHEFFSEAQAPSNDEERAQLLNVLVESIKTTMSLMSDEYKQRASGIILKLVSGMSAVTLDETAEFVSDAGLNPYIRPRVKLQMELIRLLGL